MKKYHPHTSSNLQILTLPLTTLLAFALLFICANCNKDDDTQPKHNTFRCKVNGQDWEAFDYRGGLFGMGTGPTDLQYYDDTRSIILGARRLLEDESIDQSIRIVSSPIGIGENTINELTEEFKDWNQITGCRFYSLDTTKLRRLTVLEINTQNYTMQGKFEFTAVSDCKDTVKVTNGYFHLEYRF